MPVGTRMIERLRWLHVSDFHFTSGADPFSQNVAAQALLADVRGRIEDGPRPSFVLVTGDLAFSGQPAEYEVAERFLRDLALAVDLPPDQFYLVPGNHDVDWSRQAYAFHGAKHLLTSEAAVDKFLGSTADCAQLLERQDAFWALEERFRAGAVRVFTENQLAYAASIEVDSFRMGFLGLNSAWLCGEENEDGRILLGERQIVEGLELAEGLDGQLLLAATHHPIEWLYEWDALGCHSRLLPAVDILHRGHLHTPQVAYASIPERPCLMVAAGSSHATRHYMNSYNIIDLDLGNAESAVQPYVYLPKGAHFVPDHSHRAPFTIKSQLPGTTADLASSIAESVPAAMEYSPYIAAVLSGTMGEVPSHVGDGVTFIDPNAVAELGTEDDAAYAKSLLRMRNRLRLFPAEHPLEDRVSEQVDDLTRVVKWLDVLRSESSVFQAQLDSRVRSARALCDRVELSERSYTIEFLKELRSSGDTEVLEIQARRYLASEDPALARFAIESLAEVLMRSDETEKVAEANRLAEELCGREDRRPNDFLLASASAEAAGEDSRAVEWMSRGLEAFGADPALIGHAQGLALRAGSDDLRRLLEALTRDADAEEPK